MESQPRRSILADTLFQRLSAVPRFFFNTYNGECFVSSDE